MQFFAISRQHSCRHSLDFFRCQPLLSLGLAGGIVAFIVLGVLTFFMGNCAGNTMLSMLYCVLAGLPAVAVTYGLAFIFNLPEAKLIKSLVRRFARR